MPRHTLPEPLDPQRPAVGVPPAWVAGPRVLGWFPVARPVRVRAASTRPQATDPPREQAAGRTLEPGERPVGVRADIGSAADRDQGDDPRVIGFEGLCANPAQSPWIAL